jgi:hypothetical protein
MNFYWRMSYGTGRLLSLGGGQLESAYWRGSRFLQQHPEALEGAAGFAEGWFDPRPPEMTGRNARDVGASWGYMLNQLRENPGFWRCKGSEGRVMPTVSIPPTLHVPATP